MKTASKIPAKIRSLLSLQRSGDMEKEEEQEVKKGDDEEEKTIIMSKYSLLFRGSRYNSRHVFKKLHVIQNLTAKNHPKKGNKNARH